MNTVLHPALARSISSAVNSRSVAAQMIDVILKADPFVHADFKFWVDEHRRASTRLQAMGIECLTYSVEQSQ